jgi:choline dehydrogenase-like flavoprotein
MPEFDYIVVGSGAGGGPLAARLVEKGFRVLVLEAGPDQAASDTPEREVSTVPGLHGVSTEHPGLSWRFFVKHYDTPPTGADPKEYHGSTPLERGIFYPRASGIGGCTIHNAMITIAGPDSDWEDLADYVGDDSWRSAEMRSYFQRLERNEYSPPPSDVPASWVGRAVDLLRWMFGYPSDHARGKHGFRGWLHTSVTDISLGIGDRQLVRMLKAALWQSRRARLDRAWTLVSRFLRGRIYEKLDPNHARTQTEHPEGVITVPLAVYGKRTTAAPTEAVPYVGRGRRSSPREFLLQTRADFPDRLEIWTDALVTNVLFDEGPTPRAVGVRFLRGTRLYRAHQQPSSAEGTPESVFVRTGGEVILCGGAFNTPQLLMLSGIGNAVHLNAVRAESGKPETCSLTGRDGRQMLDERRVPRSIDLPGVGRNLQDRYEVTVISEMKRDFSLLDGGTFALPGQGQPGDRHLEEWRAEGTGLYTSNGSVLGIFKRSRPDLAQPDLFMFGLPLPFEGYKVGYSTVGNQHNKFTWAILKGHTRNGDGTVRLRSADPKDPPVINFHYFNELTCPGDGDQDPDLLALVEGVKFVRGIADIAGKRLFGASVASEAYPRRDEVPPEDEQAIKDWIRRVAWGHHACGTCRMGPADDPDAVLDSRFRVRNVHGLRVVDASIFPKIPGYFIVTNIYVASEKAADVIVEDAQFGAADNAVYPRELRALEVDALRSRRQKVTAPGGGSTLPAPESGSQNWADDVTGLAISGGGVRSATFNLGVLQAFAASHWLRRIDFLSTVSGGGYIGSFLGRAYDRLRADSLWGGRREPPQSAPDRVERELNDPESPVMFWLRKHGNYIAPSGRGDDRFNTAVFIRNFLSVHFVVGALLFAIFGLVNYARYAWFGPTSAALNLIAVRRLDLPLTLLLKRLLGPFFSPWFVLFELIIVLLAVPRIVAYWIVSPERHRRYSLPSLAVMFVVTGALLYAAISDGLNFPLLVIAIAPLLGFVQAELAWRRGRKREEAVGRGSEETQRLRTRNYLTYDLSVAVALAAGALGFAVIDTIAHALQQYGASNPVYAKAIGGVIAALAAGVPLIRRVVSLFVGEQSRNEPPSAIARILRTGAMAVLLALSLILIPLILVSLASHLAYGGGESLERGIAATGLAWLVSLMLGALPGAVAFVNQSSLAQTYAARLARAYLGASNPLRFRPEGQDVTEVMAGDDVPSLRDYRPHLAGGPLHLLNVTVNQTVDFASQRGNRDRKGENLAVSCIGMTIGRKWHSAWADSRQAVAGPREHPMEMTPLGRPPGTDHPLVDATGRPARNAQMLSLRQWMAISGAAFTPGRGQVTKLGTALLFGLANIRTGYWWDSSITEGARDGFPSISALLRVLYAFESLFLTQFLVLFEWVARYPGPWERFWYLSDGGFFENLGAYELIRRRVPRIILCDATADPSYDFEDFANLMRKVRIDFDAEIVPFTDTDYSTIPAAIRERLGTLADLRPERTVDGTVARQSRKHAALFWVKYSSGPARRSVLLYFKASTTGDETVDVLEYQTKCRDFPHETTADQFFEEAQWESYRNLGQHVASECAGSTPWFWGIPLPPA